MKIILLLNEAQNLSSEDFPSFINLSTVSLPIFSPEVIGFLSISHPQDKGRIYFPLI